MMNKLVVALVCLCCFSGAADAQESDAPLPDLPGHIAYIGSDFNVYTLHLGSGERSQLTDDAGFDDDRALLYQLPTWSNDGRLAYFRLTYGPVGNINSTDVYISPDGSTDGTLVYSGVEEAFNYAYWSPRNCAASETCRDLAVLLSSQAAGGLFVELIRDSGEEASAQTIGRGAPFYYSFSPDGTRMLWQRNNQRMDVYDIDSSRIVDTLPQMPGEFFSPAWSPVDDRLLFGALNSDESATDLLIIANEEADPFAENLAGPVYFAWSPDGNRVAYTAERGPISVYDPLLDETVTHNTGSGILAFFWSPDSSSIAYITVAQAPGAFNASADKTTATPLLKQQREPVSLIWSVLDVESGEIRRYSAFIPTRDMAYLLTYFDQFAQSHRVWSPDSQNLIYGEMTAENTPVVTVLNVAEENTVPLSVAEGTVGIWSFE